MAHVLCPELADVLLDEKEVRLVSLDRVAKIVFQDHLLWISQVRSQDSNAGS